MADKNLPGQNETKPKVNPVRQGPGAVPNKQPPPAQVSKPNSPAISSAKSTDQINSTESIESSGFGSGLTEQQAREFHEQFKITYTAFIGIAALAHLLVIAAKPWI